MTTLGGDVLTLLDMSKQHVWGIEREVAEVLDQEKGLMSDIKWSPSNQHTANVSIRRVGLPTTYLRRLNSGSASSKATVSQVVDGIGMIDAWSTIDIKTAQLFGDPAKARFNQGVPFMESMGQTGEGLLWYGSVADDEMEFNGLSIRPEYASLGTQCLSAGDNTSGSLASAWLLKHAPGKLYGIYPMNLKGGIQHKSWGEQIHSESTTLGQSKLGVYQDQWMWDLGLVVADPRYAVRIPNILPADLIANTNEQANTAYATNLVHLMARADHRIAKGAGEKCWYMPRSVYEGLDVQQQIRTSGNAFETKQVQGELLTTFRGVPIKISDQLLYTEATVT
jgi:hypothetical protein